ncbi:hypothetical protein IJ00_20325 [Calothrix sp. 336/3]|nr:hypothetical protein IJ00_20325 [Calothrix sp. 336/3]
MVVIPVQNRIYKSLSKFFCGIFKELRLALPKYITLRIGKNFPRESSFDQAFTKQNQKLN